MGVVVFFDGENPVVAEKQTAVTFVALSQGQRFTGVQRLSIKLLIAFIDEHHTVVGQAERPAAVFIHPAAHAVALRRQAALAVRVPVPEATGPVFGPVFIPEQACGVDVQLGEVDARCNRLRGSQRFRKILR